MTREPVTVEEDTHVGAIVDLMERRQIKRMPVMRRNRVVGIVSRANLMHALASVAHLAAPAASDSGIREQLVADLRAQDWAPVRSINIVVHNGVVELWGSITDERQRQAHCGRREYTGGRARRRSSRLDRYTIGLVFYPPQNERSSASVLN